MSHLSRNLHTQTVNPTTLRTFGRRGKKIQRNQQWENMFKFVTREGRDTMKFTTRKFNMESLHSIMVLCHNAVQNSPPPQGLCDAKHAVQGQRTPRWTSQKQFTGCVFFFLIRCLCLFQWDTATVLIFYQLTTGKQFYQPIVPSLSFASITKRFKTNKFSENNFRLLFIINYKMLFL